MSYAVVFYLLKHSSEHWAMESSIGKQLRYQAELHSNNYEDDGECFANKASKKGARSIFHLQLGAVHKMRHA